MATRAFFVVALALAICAGAASAAFAGVVYSFPLNTSPGWTTEGQWAFGEPSGLEGNPSSGRTGANVYGYNLTGRYTDNMPAYSLTTTGLNFTGHYNVRLRFWRWLGIENYVFDSAKIQVSNDGSTWHDVWVWSGGSMVETSWTQHEYDISTWADNQATVYIRWVMGPTDSSVTYCGWNIDDIEILSGDTEILAWVPYADMSREYPNTVAALTSQYPYVNITQSTTLDPAVLATQLVGKHVFLMPEPEYASSNHLVTAGEAFADVLEAFVRGGGTVIVLGEYYDYEGFLSATGLMEAEVRNFYYSGEAMPVVEPFHPVAAGLPATVLVQNATSAYEVGPEATVIVEAPDGHAVVAVRQMGAGAVVLMGYDYWAYDDSAARLLANAVRYPRTSASVLLYESYIGDWRTGYDALALMGYEPTHSVDNNFNTALGTAPWHLVVADAPGWYPTESGGWQPFIDWVDGGGHGLVSTWDLAGAQSALCSALGASAGPNLDEVPPLYDWDAGPPLFSYQRSVPSPIATWANRAVVDANRLTVTAPDAMALAGFTASETAGEAAVVFGNDFRTLLNGFLWYERNQDADMDGVQDCVELVMNQVAMLLSVPEPFVDSDETDVQVDDEVEFYGEAHGNVTAWLWGFGDGSTSTSRDPVHAYSSPGIYDVFLWATNRNGLDTAVARRYMWVGFPDTAPDFWAFRHILECVDAGVVQGYPEGTYGPAIIVNRAQTATYIARALAGGDANVPAGPATPSFSDVPDDYWAYNYVEYAVEEGVVQGYDGGIYLPEVELDRGQMAVFVARAIAGSDAAVPPGPATPSFTDVDDDYWSYRHIEYCRDLSVVGGYPEGDYRPEELVNRAQMAVYVARSLALLP